AIRASHDDINVAVPHVLCRVFQPAAMHDASIIYEDVDTAELSQGPFDEGRDVRTARHVAMQPQSSTPIRMDLGHGFVRREDIRHGDVRTLAGQGERNRSSNPTGRTSHDSRLPFEVDGPAHG